MPQTALLFYREGDHVPALQWLREVKMQDKKAYAKCLLQLERLTELGHKLRRPEADVLRDGIYELRIRHRHVNYRMLYFFHGQQVAVLAHGCTKEDRVPTADIDRALRRKALYENDPLSHAYQHQWGEE